MSWRPGEPGLWGRDFTLTWAALLQSHFGTAFLQIGLMWLALEESGSPAIAGLILAAEGAPRFIGPVMGVVVDRSDKRWLMIGSDLVRGLALLSVFFLSWSGRLEMWQLFALVVVLGIAATVYEPCVKVLLPTLVSDARLPAANSFLEMGRMSAVIGGSLLAGASLATIGASWALFIDGITFLIAGAVLFLVRFDRPLRDRLSLGARRVLDSLLEGFRFVFGRRELVAVTAVIFISNLVLSPVNLILPVFSQQVLGEGVRGFGLMAASMAVGLLIGSLLAAALGDRLHYALAILLALSSLSVLLLGLSLSVRLAPALALTAGIGLAAPLVQIPLVSHLQRSVPRELQGRVFATLGSIVALALPLGASLAGGTLLALEVPTILRIGAGAVLCVAIVWFGLVGIARPQPRVSWSADLLAEREVPPG